MNAKFEILVNQWITARFLFFQHLFLNYVRLRNVGLFLLIWHTPIYYEKSYRKDDNLYVGDKRYNMNFPT